HGNLVAEVPRRQVYLLDGVVEADGAGPGTGHAGCANRVRLPGGRGRLVDVQQVRAVTAGERQRGGQEIKLVVQVAGRDGVVPRAAVNRGGSAEGLDVDLIVTCPGRDEDGGLR